MNLYRATLRRDGERVSECRTITIQIISEDIYYAAESIAQVWAAATELVQADEEREIVGIVEVVSSIVILGAG